MAQRQQQFDDQLRQRQQQFDDQLAQQHREFEAQLRGQRLEADDFLNHARRIAKEVHAEEEGYKPAPFGNKKNQ
jgi:hypothetical protein